MVLKFALMYSLTFTGTVELVGMINSLFDKPILPNTRYKLDQLYDCYHNAIFHGLCEQCEAYVGTFKKGKQTVLKCDIRGHDNDTSKGTYSTFFILSTINTDVVNLLQKYEAYYWFLVNERTPKPNVIADIYDGAE